MFNLRKWNKKRKFQIIHIKNIDKSRTRFSASYIQICGQRNPNLDDCVLKSIKNLKRKLIEGIPETDIMSIEPFLLNNITIIDKPNIKIVGMNVKLHHLSNFHIEYLHLDLEKMELDINLHFDKNEINVDYNMIINVSVPLQKNGSLTLKGGK